MVQIPASGAFLDTQRVIASLGITPGQHVADLGCGSGFFSIALAQAVGKDGAVSAVDVMQEPLQSVQARAEASGLANIRTIRADLEVLGGTQLPDESQDLSLLKNILFQSQKKEEILAEAARITKHGGRVVVIEWKKGAGGLGPPDELRSDEATLQTIARHNGLALDRQLSVDALHSGLVFIKTQQ